MQRGKMTDEEIEESLKSHQEILLALLCNQDYFDKFTQQVHESWREIGTELDLIKIRLSTIESEAKEAKP
jgi:hypothetical protein